MMGIGCESDNGVYVYFLTCLGSIPTPIMIDYK